MSAHGWNVMSGSQVMALVLFQIIISTAEKPCDISRLTTQAETMDKSHSLPLKVRSAFCGEYGVDFWMWLLSFMSDLLRFSVLHKFQTGRSWMFWLGQFSKSVALKKT